jgi:hypothetical protein
MGRHANQLRVKDIATGRIYAVTRVTLVDSRTGSRVDDPDTIVDARAAGTLEPHQHVEPATVERRDRDTGRWTVRYADGTTEQVALPHFHGTWDDHLAHVDLDAAADRLADVATELGWAVDDPDDALGPVAASALFGGPCAGVHHGKVRLELDADQAHLVADALRDAQAKGVR